MIDVRFGYLQELANIEWSLGSIKPLDDFDNVVEKLQSDKYAYGDWFYPPLLDITHSPKETKKPPLVPTLSYPLPSTHLLSLNSQDGTDEFANFIIALFGMLKGRRLQREEWRHFYKAPLNPMQGCVNADKREIAYALEQASKFWLKHPDAETRKLAFGALHWHLFAQLYQHSFERFNAQYMALDACCELAVKTWTGFPKKRPIHAKRPFVLCEQLGVPTPEWARIVSVGNTDTCALADCRNNLAHEAMYAGQPVGFAITNEVQTMEGELTLLVSRLLLRLLGVDNAYTRSPCTTQQSCGFGIS